MFLTQSLRGTGVALVTPFTSSGAIDYNSLGNLIDNIIDGGAEYLVILGTTAEAPVLKKEEKKKIIDFTVEKNAGRLPLVVGIGGNDTAALIDECRTFPLDRVDAILSASPYYSKPSQEGIYQHYLALAKASPKPILLYNIPGRTGRNMTAETTLRLAAHENIIGIKEAAGDFFQCMQLLKERPENFLVISGDDALTLAQTACGIDGVISVIANIYPASFSAMVREALAQNFQGARELNNALLEAYDILFAENNPAGVKAFLAEQGLIQNYLRLPNVPLSETVGQRVKAYMQANKDLR